jgi:hypothetical protein
MPRGFEKELVAAVDQEPGSKQKFLVSPSSIIYRILGHYIRREDVPEELERDGADVSTGAQETQGNRTRSSAN